MRETSSAANRVSAVPPKKPVSSRLYVTHVVLSLDCGGLERVVVDLVRQGGRRGQHVSVLCLERPGILAPQLQRMGVRVACLNKLPGLRWNTRAAVQAALRILQPDVVHTHQIAALLYTGPAAARAGIKVVHTEHSNHLARASGWLRRWRYRLLLGWSGKSAGHFCCVASDIARAVTRLRVVPARKVRVVRNGIDHTSYTTQTDQGQTRKALGIPADVPVIGTIGRLHPVKRQDLLISAFARLLAKIPTAHLVIVGEGPSHQPLDELAQRLSISSRVHLTGYIADPKPLLQIMDIFALPSQWEGMPLVILEAWASGLPVIASDVGGVPELVQPDINGLLFGNGNESALSKGIFEMLQDKGKAQALAAAGRAAVVDRYCAERMTAEYERLYRNVLGVSTLHCKTSSWKTS
jgi:glycosyltransferase involved in cell wall biosynthesis